MTAYTRPDPLAGVADLATRLQALGAARQQPRQQRHTARWCVVALVLVSCLAFGAGRATAATWHGHSYHVRMDGQIDATPCPTGATCLRAYVGVYRDGMNLADHLVRCAWPRHPRILEFDRGHHGHPRLWYVKVRTCGRHYWWRVRP